MAEDSVTAHLWPKTTKDAKTVFKKLHEMGVVGIDAQAINPITARFNPNAEPFKSSPRALEDLEHLCERIEIVG